LLSTTGSGTGAADGIGAGDDASSPPVIGTRSRTVERRRGNSGSAVGVGGGGATFIAARGGGAASVTTVSNSGSAED
jgi:hypothetical protein